MNQTQNEILQQNLNTLTIIIRHWLLILEQLEILQSDLECVPVELEVLQKQLEQLEAHQRLSLIHILFLKFFASAKR